VADNPDGAHMRGLNANMIQAVISSGIEDAAFLNHDHVRGLSEAEKQAEDSERNVWLTGLIFGVCITLHYFRWTFKHS
jgi:hypothetical protein